MKILIGCEYSAVVRSAFIAAGHDAISCDLVKRPGDGLHWNCDVFEAIGARVWDMAIFFPPCTYLSRACANRWTESKARMRASLSAITFARKLSAAHIPKICIENPPGMLPRFIGNYSQIIQPWQFGDDHRKEICLWLKNLPPLICGMSVASRRPMSNHTNSRMTQAERGLIRSRFFPAIAKAMAEQWG